MAGVDSVSTFDKRSRSHLASRCSGSVLEIESVLCGLVEGSNSKAQNVDSNCGVFVDLVAVSVKVRAIRARIGAADALYACVPGRCPAYCNCPCDAGHSSPPGPPHFCEGFIPSRLRRFYPWPTAAAQRSGSISQKLVSTQRFSTPTSPAISVPGLPHQTTRNCAFVPS